MVSVPMSKLRVLGPLAEQAGVELPGLIATQGKVSLDEPDSVIARELGMLCARQPIFRQGEELVAVDDEGELQAMTPARFGGWVEKFVTTYKLNRERGGEWATTMGENHAKRILVNDAFLCQVRRVDFYYPMRLPVLREKGKVLELLEPGYDAATRSWTEVSLEWDTEWDLDRAVDWFAKVLGEWPWADLVHERERDLRKSRNAAVVLAGMLGTFCRAFFRPGERRPMVVVAGNGVGTGKSTLCKLMMAPVFGLPPEDDLPGVESEFKRLLESTMLGFEPYLFLDDVGKKLQSHALNRFVTASVHSGTKLYKKAKFKVPNVTQVFASGLDLKFDHNIARRAMVCELFLPGEVQGRKFGYEVTDKVLGSPEFRSEALSAMWVVVKEWHARRGEGLLTKRRELASFESYSRTVCAMTEVLGWRDPLDAPEMITGGDVESRDFKALLMALAQGQGVEVEEYSTTDLVAKARELHLLEELVGVESDGALKKGDRISFGRRLEKFRGKVYEGEDGIFFQFGKRDGKGGSVYPCRKALRAEDLF